MDHACPWLVQHASAGVAGAVDATTLNSAIANLRGQLADIP